MEGLTEKQIARIERIRAERTKSAPRIRPDLPSTGRFGLSKSAAESVFTNPDLLKQIGAFTNPKDEGFLVYLDTFGVKEIIEVGNSLKETRLSKKKSLFIGRYWFLTSNGPDKGKFLDLFWPNLDSKSDAKQGRLDQRPILDFPYPGRPMNQDIFTRPSRKAKLFFLPLKVLLQHFHGYYEKNEIDKIKNQAYLNNWDYPVLDSEKLRDKLR